jgi:hypothetical protein
VTEEHRGERKRDRAESIPKTDQQRPSFAHGRPQQTKQQQDDQDRGNPTLNKGQRLDGGQRVRCPSSGRGGSEREEPIDWHSQERRPGRLVRVVVPVVEGLVPGVLFQTVDSSCPVLDERSNKVVAAVLIPGRNLSEEAITEQQGKPDNDLATGPGIEAYPSAPGVRGGSWRSQVGHVINRRPERNPSPQSLADSSGEHHRQSRTSHLVAGADHGDRRGLLPGQAGLRPVRSPRACCPEIEMLSTFNGHRDRRVRLRQ